MLSNLTVDLLGGPNGATQIKPGNIVKNRGELQADKLPGIIVLAADEVKDSRTLKVPPGMLQNRMPVQLMRMTPEIYVQLDTRPVGNEHVLDDLEAARLAILNAICVDDELWKIVGPNGDITYDGCVTDLARNRQMKGQLGISVTFTYPLVIAEYTEV